MSDESQALPGVRAGGSLSGCVVRLVGTSVAAPQEARRIANGKATASPPPHSVDPDLDGDEGWRPFSRRLTT